MSGFALIEPVEVRREAWWKEPPKPGDKADDLKWCYIVEYDNGDIRLVDETPMPEEIAEKKVNLFHE